MHFSPGSVTMLRDRPMAGKPSHKILELIRELEAEGKL